MIMSIQSLGNPNIIYEDLPKVPSLAKAHGSLMGLAFVVIFPVGAVLIRVVRTKNAIWIHTTCQFVGWVLMIGGLACGIKMGKILDRVSLFWHLCVSQRYPISSCPIVVLTNRRDAPVAQQRAYYPWYGGRRSHASPTLSRIYPSSTIPFNTEKDHLDPLPRMVRACAHPSGHRQWGIWPEVI